MDKLLHMMARAYQLARELRQIETLIEIEQDRQRTQPKKETPCTPQESQQP
jgi:hypothetical protein